MAATVSKLYKHMISIESPNALMDISDELPTDPELRKEALKCKKTGEYKKFLTLMGQIMPKDGDQVYENIFIGGKKHVQDIDWLKNHGITHVLNAADGQNTDSFVATYSVNKDAMKGKSPTFIII